MTDEAGLVLAIDPAAPAAAPNLPEVSASAEDAKDYASDNHIIVTGDIFRLQDPLTPGKLRWHQADNVSWLRHVIAGALGSNPDIRVGVMDHDALGLTAENFGPGRGQSAEQWWIDRTDGTLEPDLGGRLREKVAGRVVMAFELSASLRNAILETARVLIELEIAPVRFCDDLFLYVSCSDPELQARFWQSRVTEREIHWQLGLLRAQISGRSDASLPKARIALLAAQTSADRALIANGRMLSIADYLPEVAEIAATHDLVLVRPHPHASGETSAERLLLTVPGVRVTTANTYRLLVSRGIDTLAAISSSLLIEAPYFGVAAIRLGPAVPKVAPMLRLQTLSGGFADAIARAAGFALPDSGFEAAPGRPSLEDVLGFNWAASLILDTQPALPAIQVESLPLRIGPNDEAWATALTYGWHSPEPWGTWSTSLGVVSFEWPGDRAATLLCILELRCSVPDQPTQIASIWSDGALLAKAALPAGLLVPLAVEIARPTRPGPVQLWLCCDPLFCPAEALSGGTDTRRLGIGLVGVEFR